MGLLTMKTAYRLILCSASLLAVVAHAQPYPLADPESVARVTAGELKVAEATWWGFDPEDSTEAVQQAIDSGARTVVVPFVGLPWIVRPLTLRGNLNFLLEPGVVLLAKRGEFSGKGDSLLTVAGCDNVTIRGYGATLRMWKQDYQNPPYEPAEWRMGIRIAGCKNVRVEGFRIESSGGDGIYIDGGGGSNRLWSEDIAIRDCVVDDHHRQGISVISCENLLVEKCVFSNTSGTPPTAGIDLEPDGPEQRLVHCLIRNCRFENNEGHNILVYLKPMTRASEPVSIRFENCLSIMGGVDDPPPADRSRIGWAGMAVGAISDDGPQGLIEFVNCTSINAGKEGVRVFDKSAHSAKVRFANCTWQGAWTWDDPTDPVPRVPVSLHLRRPELTKALGGVDFEHCVVIDSENRPAVNYARDEGDYPLVDVTGTITVYNPHGVSTNLEPQAETVTLNVTAPR